MFSLSFQGCRLFETPGNVTIHAVQDRCQRKGGQPQPAMQFLAGFEIGKNLDDEKRDQQNPEDGDFVGRGHTLIGILPRGAMFCQTVKECDFPGGGHARTA